MGLICDVFDLGWSLSALHGGMCRGATDGCSRIVVLDIARKHGYSKKLIENIYKETSHKQENRVNAPHEQKNSLGQYDNRQIEKRFEVLPDALRSFRTVGNLMKKNNKKPAFRRPTTIFNLLKNTKEEGTGIYEIPLTNVNR